MVEQSLPSPQNLAGIVGPARQDIPSSPSTLDFTSRKVYSPSRPHHRRHERIKEAGTGQASANFLIYKSLPTVLASFFLLQLLPKLQLQSQHHLHTNSQSFATPAQSSFTSIIMDNFSDYPDMLHVAGWLSQEQDASMGTQEIASDVNDLGFFEEFFDDQGGLATTEKNDLEKLKATHEREKQELKVSTHCS